MVLILWQWLIWSNFEVYPYYCNEIISKTEMIPRWEIFHRFHPFLCPKWAKCWLFPVAWGETNNCWKCVNRYMRWRQKQQTLCRGCMKNDTIFGLMGVQTDNADENAHWIYFADVAKIRCTLVLHKVHSDSGWIAC